MVCISVQEWKRLHYTSFLIDLCVTEVPTAFRSSCNSFSCDCYQLVMWLGVSLRSTCIWSNQLYWLSCLRLLLLSLCNFFFIQVSFSYCWELENMNVGLPWLLLVWNLLNQNIFSLDQFSILNISLLSCCCCFANCCWLLLSLSGRFCICF